MTLSEHTDSYAQALYFHQEQFPDCAISGSSSVVFRAMDNKYFKEILSRSKAVYALQSFKPYAKSVSRYELRMDYPEKGSCDYALVMATRDKQESLGLIAEASDALADDGLLMLVAANELGAGPLIKRMKSLGPAEVSFKARCKVAHLWKKDILDFSSLEAWKEDCKPHIHKEGNLLSVPGIFSWKSIDKGSAILARHFGIIDGGLVADPGCGNGYLSHALLEQADGIEGVHLYDIEQKALDCARLNLSSSSVPISYYWHDVLKEELKDTYDWVIMNPPFHRDTITDPETGKRFIVRAAESLKSGGKLLMVANNNLPYLPVLKEHFTSFETLEKDAGFRVIYAIK